MSKTGPQKYPGASTVNWWQSKWGGDSMESNVIVWHTTEGTNLDSYNNGATAPNFTAKPDFTAKKMVWYQHFDFDTSARALVHAGAVATNTLNVCQVEIVGTCDPVTHAKWAKAGVQHLYSPELPDWAIRDLAAFAKWAKVNHGVPLTSGLQFKPYPSSYGAANGVRMSDSKWLSYKGHCGHQHVPSGNMHGDPGAFPMSRILSVAAGSATTPSTTPTPTPAEHEMQLSDQVTLGDWIPKYWPDDQGLQDKKMPVDILLGSGYAHARKSAENSIKILNQLAAQQAMIDELVKTVASLATNTQALDPEALVTRIKTAIESVTVHLDVPEQS